ncbi:Hypothetical predicted protein, partial [Paramuricea clavata]
MPLRGPYKQYEVDTRIAVPKSTVYDRRKRHFAEIDSDTDSEADQHDVDREHDDATLNRTVASGHERSDESDAEDTYNIPNYVSDPESQDDLDVNNGDESEEEADFLNAAGIHQNPVGSQHVLNGNRDNPIYEGAHITIAQCLLLILCFVVRHCLTKEALKDLLILLNLLLPHSVPATQYKFFKAFENVNFQTHYYCPSCLFYLELTRAIVSSDRHPTSI